jgi:hypothetical protein
MSQREFVQSLLNRAVERVNGGVSKTLTARRTSEAPPLDPRHLTDTRTRVSTLLEYSLAYEMNHLLAGEGKGFSVSAVLWNVFPDLLIRDARRSPVIGLEVKALHTAAEEKSANLSTPLHVIKKGSDFLVILIWAWQRHNIEGVSVTYPHVHVAEVFDAYLLAQTRDYSWLFNQGGRIKGIDISTPIISSEKRLKGDCFKAEEGNMGKLMRIELDAALPDTTPNMTELRKEAEKYQRFKDRALGLGLSETFREICDLQQASQVQCQPPSEYPRALRELGRAQLPRGTTFCLFAGGSTSHLSQAAQDLAQHPAGTVALWLSSKLNWTVLKATGAGWREIARGNKPDTAYDQIKKAIDG